MTDVVILAKHATQVAMSQKNGPGSFPAHKGIFLAKMRAVAGDHCLAPTLAYTDLLLQSIDFAMSRTEMAAL
jgi:hypothetical protein